MRDTWTCAETNRPTRLPMTANRERAAQTGDLPGVPAGADEEESGAQHDLDLKSRMLRTMQRNIAEGRQDTDA